MLLSSAQRITTHISITVQLDATLYNLVGRRQLFGLTSCVHVPERKDCSHSSVLKMDAVTSAEVLVQRTKPNGIKTQDTPQVTKMFHFPSPSASSSHPSCFIQNFNVKSVYSLPRSVLTRQILAEVPQGSVPGPLLYLIYTDDLSTLANSTTATFADDTAILTVHEDPTMAAHRLKMHLNKIQSWLETWRMKGNEAKSVQVTYTLNKMIIYPKRTR